MKTFIRHIKCGSILLAMMILFQSCRVYRHQPSTLDAAVQQETYVKLKTKEGKILKFKKVELIDGEYYGISKVKRKNVKVPLNPNNIETLRIHNKTLSIVYSTGIGLLVASIVGIIAVFDTTDNLSVW